MGSLGGFRNSGANRLAARKLNGAIKCFPGTIIAITPESCEYMKKLCQKKILCKIDVEKCQHILDIIHEEECKIT